MARYGHSSIMVTLAIGRKYAAYRDRGLAIRRERHEMPRHHAAYRYSRVNAHRPHRGDELYRRARLLSRKFVTSILPWRRH